ncbi:MAG: hypothetical protein QOI88_4411 [Gammaproteobacteria bacterium]|jgi:hypothetical protein|nr:hypothetical protein [Gammaproteobacteria bacterium]
MRGLVAGNLMSRNNKSCRINLAFVRRGLENQIRNITRMR